jgi:hypothetical protein
MAAAEKKGKGEGAETAGLNGFFRFSFCLISLCLA